MATGVSEQWSRTTVRARSSGTCEGCGQARATDHQHRKNRSQGGTWAVSNALSMCHPCHMWLHRQPAQAVRLGWTVGRMADPADAPAWLHTWLGQGWYLLTDWGGYQPIEGPPPPPPWGP